MFLEAAPSIGLNLTKEITNQVISNSSDIVQSLLSTFKPILAIVGGLLGLYIIYKIVQAVSDYFFKKRVKRIEKNVLELNEKVDEILHVLKNQEALKTPKKKK